MEKSLEKTPEFEKMLLENFEKEMSRYVKELAQNTSSIVESKYQEMVQASEQRQVEMMQAIAVEKKELESMKHSLTVEFEEKEKILKLNEQKLKHSIEQMEKIHKFQDCQIKLDIGGTYFSTSVTTLTKDPDSMLGTMFSGRFPIKKNEEGRVFIDRDASLFSIVLEYLRDGEFDIPEDSKIVSKLLREVKYYGLTGMEELLSKEISVGENTSNTNTSLIPESSQQRKIIAELEYQMNASGLVIGSTYFVISSKWWKSWQNHVCYNPSKFNNNAAPSPGTINNFDILSLDMAYESYSFDEKWYALRKNLDEHDYVIVSTEMYQKLFSW